MKTRVLNNLYIKMIQILVIFLKFGYNFWYIGFGDLYVIEETLYQNPTNRWFYVSVKMLI